MAKKLKHKYIIVDTDHSKNWTYKTIQKEETVLEYQCGYDHQREEIWFKRFSCEKDYNNVGTYGEFLIQRDLFLALQHDICSNFDKKVFEAIKSVIFTFKKSN